MYLHKTKNENYTPPCCYFSGELEVVECATSNFQWRHDGLGCINDYVENQHVNTIIVANEKAIREQEANKLESDKIAIGYAEIKEKVVERQLAFQSEVPVKQDELRSNPTS